MNDLRMVKRTVRIYEADLALAKRFYPHVGYNHIIRLLLHRHLVRLENAVREREASLTPDDPDKTISNEILVLGDSNGA